MRISSTLLSILVTVACASEPPVQPQLPVTEDPVETGDGDGDQSQEESSTDPSEPDDPTPDDPSEPDDPTPDDPSEPDDPEDPPIDEPDEPDEPDQPEGFTDVARCNEASLEWRSGRKTNYESYPEPGSSECIDFSGCEHMGQFAACRGMKSEEWVAAHNIVAAFPDFQDLELHDLCVRDGDNYIVVTVYDTCGDHDCDGCCTRARGDNDQLIDFEMYTHQRWGVDDGELEWADLGPTQGPGCEGE